jgi:PAS domain S-box-containing protein
MSEATTFVNGSAAAEKDNGSPFSTRGYLVLPLAVLALGLGASAWNYVQDTRQFGSRALFSSESPAMEQRELRSLREQFEHSSIWLLAGSAAAGCACALALALVFSMHKRALARRLEAEQGRLISDSEKMQRRLADTNQQMEHLRSQCARLEERSLELAQSNAALQHKLDQRHQNEKALAQKRLELESSKTVLEVHVQARTLQLQQLQHRYEMILNSAGEGICGLDSEGKTTFVNPAVYRMTGWPMEELIGRSEHELFGANGANLPAMNPGEQVFRRKDGTLFPVECVKTEINENGRITGSVLLFKDIAERKHAEDRLAQRAAELARSNAELEQFAFVASHDLQEPLRKIQAFGDRLKIKCASLDADALDYLDRMQGAAARMRNLIDDLLTFSRTIRSTEPFVPVDLGAITREVLSDLEVRIEKTGARVEAGNLPTLDADPMQMRQLLLNLMGNALKFQAPNAKPVVNITARTFDKVSGEPFCELSVQDNGIGFDEKYSEKIFAVFQRLHGRNEYEGAGIGLAVCRRIVDRHHGAIVGRSKPGEGATFIVTLPMRQAKPDASA